MDIQYHALGYATRMTPKKGGYTTPAPALDLTTSLRGDFGTKYPTHMHNKHRLAVAISYGPFVSCNYFSEATRMLVAPTNIWHPLQLAYKRVLPTITPRKLVHFCWAKWCNSKLLPPKYFQKDLVCLQAILGAL